MKEKFVLLFIVLVLVLSACAPLAETTAIPTQPAEDTATNAPVEEATSEPTAAPLVHLNACYSATSPTQAPAWYAYENGLFEKYGLDIELTFISSGSKSVTALVAGDVDICQVAVASVVSAVAAGQDVVFIAGLFNTYPGSLYVKPEIQSAEDLKGKSLAVSQPGGGNPVATNLILNELGLKPNEDVSLLAFGTEPERLAALEAGQVDGALLFPPATLVAAEKGFFNLYDLGKTKIPYQFVGIATSQALIDSDHQSVTAFLQAITEASLLMKQDRDGSIAVMAKYMELDPVADRVNLEETYQAIIIDVLESKPYPTVEGTQIVIDSLVSDNPDVANLSPDQILNTTILEELDQSGFFDSLP